MTTTCFIISIFGEKYLPFLPVNIFSINKSYNSEVSIIVLYNDISDKKIDEIKKTFPKFDFIKLNIDTVLSDSKSRLNTKLLFWNSILKDVSSKNIIFIDVDTLLLKNIDEIFYDDFDIAITYCDNEKPKFPINTGLLAVKKNSTSMYVFNEWINNLNQFIKYPKKFTTLYKKYGSGDQLSLMQTIGEPSDFSSIKTYNVNDVRCKIKWIGTTEYNNSYSTSVNENIRMIHYKSKWHNILLDKVPLDSIETRKDFGEIYDLYMKYEEMYNQYASSI